MTASAEKKAFDKALKLLTYRDHSCQELCRKLRERGFDDDILHHAVQRLIESGYLDDSRYAARWARHLAVDKLYGNARIRASLMEKGIARDLIEEALKETRAELSETEGLDRLLQKKGSSVTVESSEAGETERRVPKLLQALVRKGYPLEMVYEKLRKLKIDTPDV